MSPSAAWPLVAIVVVVLFVLLRQKGGSTASVSTADPPTQPNAQRPKSRRSLASTKMSELPINEPGCLDLGSGHDCHIGIVGESQRQGALRSIDGGRRRKGQAVTFIAEVVREPDNPYDANAVKVCGPEGQLLGYLARDDAEQYQMCLKALAEAGKKGRCRAKLIGGTEDKPSFGVMIDLRPPEELLELVSPQPF